MKSILVVDDTAICREPIVAVLRQEGYDARGAAGGKAALESLASRRPDLLLLDLQMPELDGWTVLRAIRKAGGFDDLPVILLTASVDRHYVVRARQLGVQDYLLKSQFSLPEMLARVRKRLETNGGPPVGTGGPEAPSATAPAKASAGTRGHATCAAMASPAPTEPAGAAAGSRPEQHRALEPLTRDDIVGRLEACTHAKTLAGVVAEVVSLAGSPRGSLADLASLLKRDPVLCTRVLQLANTAGFASAKPMISTIEEAVRNVGAGAVRNTAASVGIFESFSATAADGIGLVRCWQHCFAVAALMDRLVPAADAASHDVAYLVGLCHDLGEIVLRQHFATEYEASLQLTAASGIGLRDALATTFGMPQHQLVALILSKLGLPESISSPIQSFFRCQGAAGGSDGDVLPRALALADQYAHGLLLASAGDAPIAPVPEADLRGVAGKRDLAVDGPALRGEVVATTGHLTRASASEQESLFRPLFRTIRAKVWYARHPALAALDPLGAALSFLADTQHHDRLPSGAQELGEWRATVAAVPPSAAAGRWVDEAKVLAQTQPGRRVLFLFARGEVPQCYPTANLVVAEYPLPLAKLYEFLTTC